MIIVLIVVLLLLLLLLSSIIVVVLSKMTLVRILVISRSRSSVVIRRRGGVMMIIVLIVMAVMMSTMVVERVAIVVGVLLMLLIVVVVVVRRTRTTEGKLSSHGTEGSRHLENFLALFTLLLLEPSAVVSEFLELRECGGNPDTVNVEEDALVHGMDETVGIIFIHLDEAAAIVVTAGLDVRASVEDVNTRAFDEEVSEHLDAGEREVEGKLGDKDIADGLAIVLREGGDGARPGGDVFTNAVTRFTAHDGGFSDDIEEEVRDILEEMLHSTNRSTRSFSLLLLLLVHVIIIEVIFTNHQLMFVFRTRRVGVSLFVRTGSRGGKGRRSIVIVIVIVLGDLLFSLSTAAGSFRVGHDNFIQKIVVVLRMRTRHVVSVCVFVTRVVVKRVLLLMLMLLARSGGTRSSRTTVTTRMAWSVVDIDLGKVVVGVITESSLHTNVRVGRTTTLLRSGSSRLRSSGRRHSFF